jgi:hypothetical protein
LLPSLKLFDKVAVLQQRRLANSDTPVVLFGVTITIMMQLDKCLYSDVENGLFPPRIYQFSLVDYTTHASRGI